MQNLRSVFAKVYRGGRSMGSHQARNFSFSSPPGSSASNEAARHLVRGIAVVLGYVMSPYVSKDLEREGEEKRKEIERQYEEYYEQSEKLWSSKLDDHQRSKRG